MMKCLLTVFLEMWNTEKREFLPLDEICKRRLKYNWRTLLTSIQLNSGLIDEMFAKGCISIRQRNSITCQHPAEASITKLLEIVYRKSLAAFDSFINCLKSTAQQHVAHLLTTDSGNNVLQFIAVLQLCMLCIL
jgi:Caspase recruitment domain